MPQISDSKLNDLIDSIYNTTINPSSDPWQSVFKEISELFSCGTSTLSLYIKDKNKFELVTSTIDEDIFQEYTDYYHKISPFRKIIERMNVGEKFLRSEHCSDADFRETEIYQDYFKRLDVFHYDYEVLFKESEISGGISLSRPASLGNFTDEDYKAISLLTPHIKRAFQVYFRINQVKRNKQIMSEVLDRIPYSVIVVNKSGKVVFVNERAERILEKKDGLQINRKKNLISNSSNGTKKLRKVLQNVFSPKIDKNFQHGGTVQLSRPSGKRPLSVLISPLEREFEDLITLQKTAILFVSDPEEQIETKERVLSEIYNLTPAEARVATLLVQGNSLHKICEKLNVKKSTVRTHLKRIFSKTDTNKQSDLIRLILTGPANINLEKVGN